MSDLFAKLRSIPADFWTMDVDGEVFADADDAGMVIAGLIRQYEEEEDWEPKGRDGMEGYSHLAEHAFEIWEESEIEDDDERISDALDRATDRLNYTSYLLDFLSVNDDDDLVLHEPIEDNGRWDDVARAAIRSEVRDRFLQMIEDRKNG